MERELYNKYLIPFWQDSMHKDEIWEKINNIPNDKAKYEQNTTKCCS